MASKFASLFIKVDSKQVKKGTADLKKLSKEADKTTAAAKGMGKAFASVAVALAGGALFKNVISNTIEQQRVTAQLNATLKSTGNYSEELSQNLQNYASELQKVTTYGDGAIISSQALLLTFRRIGGDTFPRAQMAVLDVATAMGTDLKSAAIQVGKALNDPVIGMTALSQSGITFTQTQKDLVKGFIETNQLAKAQDVILKELEAQFEGSAEAAANTLGGSIKQLQNSFGDLLEGDEGSTTEVIASIKELTKSLNDPQVKAGFQAMVTGVFAVTQQFAVLASYIGGDSPLKQLQDQTDDAREKFELLLSEYNKFRLFRINPFASTEDLEDDIVAAKAAWKALEEQVWNYGKAADDLKSPKIKFDAAAAIETGKALDKALKDAQKEAGKTVKSFQDMYAKITEAAKVPDEDVTVLDVDLARIQAEQLLRTGDIDGAVAKAKEGFALLEQMKSAGNLDDSLVEYYADLLRDTGVDAASTPALEAQINIDEDLARQTALAAVAAAQAVVTANPLVQEYMISPAGTGTTANIPQTIADTSAVPDAATQQASAPNLVPTIINMPDGSSHTVYGDAGTVDSFAKTVQKEAMKGGKR